MNIAICDDNERDALAAREVISKALKELHIKSEIAYYLNAEGIQEKLLKKKESLDMLILDIDMPKISGLELAESLRAENLNLIIIFLSAHEEFVFKAIEFQPFRYIRKNKLETEMPIAIRSAVKVFAANSDLQIVINTDDGDTKIMMSEIVYYETEKRKIAIILKSGRKLLVNKTVSEMQELVNHEKFIMIHRSCVVNADYVKNISNGIIILDNDNKLIVSRPRYKEVKNKILKLWGELI